MKEEYEEREKMDRKRRKKHGVLMLQKCKKILSRLRSMNNKKLKIPERKHHEEHFTKCDRCRYLSECIEKGRVMDITGLEDMRMHFTAGRHCKGWRES